MFGFNKNEADTASSGDGIHSPNKQRGFIGSMSNPKDEVEGRKDRVLKIIGDGRADVRIGKNMPKAWK